MISKGKPKKAVTKVEKATAPKPVKAFPETEPTVCECPQKHDISEKKFRGVIVSAPGIKKRFFLKCGPEQRKKHCYNYTLSLVRADIKAAKKAAAEIAKEEPTPVIPDPEPVNPFVDENPHPI